VHESVNGTRIWLLPDPRELDMLRRVQTRGGQRTVGGNE
jgi:hypothetical protein